MGVPAGSELIATIGNNEVYLYTYDSVYSESFGEVENFQIYNQNGLIYTPSGDINSIYNYGVLNGKDIFYTTLAPLSTNNDVTTITLYATNGSSVSALTSWNNVGRIITETQINQTLIFYIQSTYPGQTSLSYGGIYSTSGGTPQELLNMPLNTNVSQSPFGFVSTNYGAVFEVVDDTYSNFDLVNSETKIYETDGGSASLVWDLSSTSGVSVLPTPIVTKAGNASVNYGASTSISGFSVLDENGASGTFSVKVTSNDGTVSSTGGAGSVGGNGTQMLVLSGTMSQVNQDLTFLSFTGSAVGSGSVSVSATYAGATSSTQTASVTVVGGPPTLANQIISQSAAAGQQLTLQLPSNTFSAPQGETLTYSASLSNGSALPAWLSFNAANQTFSGLAPALGPQIFSIKVTAENSSSQSASDTFSLSLTGPAAPVLSVTGAGGLTNSLTQTIKGTIDAADAGLTVSIYDGSTLLGTATPATDGDWSGVFTLPSTQGAQTITAQASDAGGAVGKSSVVTYTLDTAPPTLTLFSPGGLVDSRAQAISGSIDVADAGLTISIYDGTTLLGTATPNGSGDWQTTVTLPSAPGAQSITAQATDAAGNAGKSAVVNFTLSFNADTDDFNGDGKSDILIENTSGAVYVGEVTGGQVTYSAVASLGSEWTFKGTGDFTGDGKEGFLIESTSGAVYVGEVSGGNTTYLGVASLGPEWSFEGTGDFLGAGKDQFLIENTAGEVVVGEVVSGLAQYTAVASLGPEWKFVGTGDYLGDSKSDFLIENTSGAVYVGEVTGGQATYTAVASLGSEWKFVESGDFMGDGKADFLIENTSGAVYVGEVSGGQVTYTAVASLGSEWSFVGEGDYSGTGKDSFVIENTAGGVYTGTIVSGTAQYAQIAALGSTWKFHG
jgi:Putative Ig domain/Bacterial Ig-like domain